MATQTLQPVRNISPKIALVSLAAAAAAVGAGFGVAALVLDEPSATTPSSVVVEGPAAQPGSDAYDGTNREVRQLMHRR